MEGSVDLPVFFDSCSMRLGLSCGCLSMDRCAVCVSMAIVVAVVIIGGTAGMVRFLGLDRGGRKV
jgi:hypothetical protein